MVVVFILELIAKYQVFFQVKITLSAYHQVTANVKDSLSTKMISREQAQRRMISNSLEGPYRPHGGRGRNLNQLVSSVGTAGSDYRYSEARDLDEDARAESAKYKWGY